MPTNAHFTNAKTWDMHVLVWPWLNNVLFSEYTRSNSYLATTVGTQISLGGIQIIGAVAGTPLNIDSIEDTDVCPQIGLIELDPVYQTGVGRLVSLGVEVVDNTAELYKQGNLIAWRAPQPYRDYSTWWWGNYGESGPNTASGQAMRYPARTAAEAKLYNNVEWPAPKGCYMVANFNDGNIPKAIDYAQPYIPSFTGIEDVPTDFTGAAYSLNTNNVWFPHRITSGISGLMVPAGFNIQAINQMGIQCFGLSPNAAFTIKTVMVYETFPSIAQKDILSLAQPAAMYDPKALEEYQRIIASLPVAVPYGMNPAGEFFAMVLDVLAAGVVPISIFMGNPEAGAAASYVLKKGAEWARR
jgi:hypothetical protein